MSLILEGPYHSKGLLARFGSNPTKNMATKTDASEKGTDKPSNVKFDLLE